MAKVLLPAGGNRIRKGRAVPGSQGHVFHFDQAQSVVALLRLLDGNVRKRRVSCSGVPQNKIEAAGPEGELAADKRIPRKIREGMVQQQVFDKTVGVHGIDPHPAIRHSDRLQGVAQLAVGLGAMVGQHNRPPRLPA